MGKYGIETFDELFVEREKIQRDMDALIVRRTKLQNKIRRAAPAEKKTLRQEKMDLYFANEQRAKKAQQQKKSQRSKRDAR